MLAQRDSLLTVDAETIRPHEMSYSLNETLQYSVSLAQESLAFASTPYMRVCRRIHIFVRRASKFAVRIDTTH